jgi:hypothetical protein
VNSFRLAFLLINKGMASAGTLLSDLDSKPPAGNGNDDDLVSSILNEMNRSPSSQQPMMPPQQPMQSPPGRVINSPNPNTTYPTSIDPATATAHMIGKEYPTAADFANLMHQSPGSGYAHGGSAFAQIQQQPQPILYQQPVQGNYYSEIIAHLKQPLLVAIIIFVVSLPAVNILIGHYLPTMLRAGGDLTTSGLVIKGAVGGALFWIIQKILVPLMAV